MAIPIMFRRGLSAEELESYNDYDNANLYNDHVVASLIKDFKAADPNGFPVYFSDHGEEVYDTPPHKTQGRNEDNPTRHMYTIPFCCGRRKMASDSSP